MTICQLSGPSVEYWGPKSLFNRPDATLRYRTQNRYPLRQNIVGDCTAVLGLITGMTATQSGCCVCGEGGIAIHRWNQTGTGTGTGEKPLFPTWKHERRRSTSISGGERAHIPLFFHERVRLASEHTCKLPLCLRTYCVYAHTCAQLTRNYMLKDYELRQNIYVLTDNTHRQGLHTLTNYIVLNCTPTKIVIKYS